MFHNIMSFKTLNNEMKAIIVQLWLLINNECLYKDFLCWVINYLETNFCHVDVCGTQ